MKILFTLLINIVICNVANAVDFAAIVGYRSNGLNGDIGNNNYQTTSKYQFGALVLIPIFAENVKVRTGFIYAVKDMTGSTYYQTQFVSFHDKMSYVDIPLDLQINIPSTDLYFYAGAKYGIKQNSNCDDDNPNMTCNIGRGPTNIVENIAVGYNVLTLGSSTLGFEVEYENGFSDINHTPDLGTERTNSWNVNLVVKF